MNDQKHVRPARLGELEAEIMRIVWDRGEVSVGEVRRALAPRRDSAYTTVMTVMTRLLGKGLLQRHKEGRAYVYRAAAEQEEVAGSLLSSFVGRLYGASAARAIAHLIETEETVDDAELERLEELIRRRRGLSE